MPGQIKSAEVEQAIEPPESLIRVTAREIASSAMKKKKKN